MLSIFPGDDPMIAGRGPPAAQYLLAIGRSMAGNLVRISVP
ncbi:MAG: hypothetical protein QOH87_3207 [Trebonia sp.]|jgi:hypothetical protein|nr:hypothetical protein [Trebonia sp.]